MNKKGQFFLIMAFIVLGLIAGLATVTNSVDKKIDARFNYVKGELNLESEKAIDYGVSQNFDSAQMKTLLRDFTEDYSSYSNADDFYYIFGTTGEITFAGLKKQSGGTIQTNQNPSTIILSQGFFMTQDFSNPTNPVILTIDGTVYPFTLRTGQNFYFVVSKSVEGDVYVATNS